MKADLVRWKGLVKVLKRSPLLNLNGFKGLILCSEMAEAFVCEPGMQVMFRVIQLLHHFFMVFSFSYRNFHKSKLQT